MTHLELPYKPVATNGDGLDGRLVVVSNRVPLPTSSAGPLAGGLGIALQAALKTRGGVWFGWSGRVSQELEAALHVRTFGAISYAVSDLSRRDIDEYYLGFANQVLWPICHYRLDLANLCARDASSYFRVNEQFAQRLVKILRPADVVWAHDYHFIPIGTCLRRRGCVNRMGFFLHIPWPGPDVAAALPEYDRILRSFSAYDLVGFQTPVDAENFCDCLVQAKVGKVVGDGWCEAYGRRFQVGAFPISIDADAFALEARVAERNIVVKRMRASLQDREMIIGVDRLDYSKGVKQRIEAFSAFLERSPQAARTRVTMLQITPKSRSEVPDCAKIQREVAEQVGRVNGRWGDVDWTPLRYINKVMSQSALAGLYRVARVGLVTPLRDGMNLVAKEYVAAQAPENPGVLILSQFAGAAQELEQALIVNPYDIEATADAITRAFAMPLEERMERWAAMMETLRSNNVDAWIRSFLQALGGDAELRESELLLDLARDVAQPEAWRATPHARRGTDIQLPPRMEPAFSC